MYPHHQKAIEQMTDYFKAMDGVIAVILGGSVTKGTERVDSDIDGMIVVTPELYAAQAAKNALAETISGICDYPGGYFDVKYYTKDYLQDAADHGSEPQRNAYLCSRVLYTSDPEITEIAARIPVFQKGEKQEKLRVFYASLMMNYHYFWDLRGENKYIEVRTATEIVYTAYRLILQENEILFPCNRNLQDYVEKAPRKPENITQLGDIFLGSLDHDDCKRFVEAVDNWTEYKPENEKLGQTKYVEYYELWWKNPRPFVNEW